MEEERNRLLKRQLRKHQVPEEIQDQMADFLNAVSRSYDHNEEDRKIMERSMDISSSELQEKNQKLQRQTEALDQFIYRISHDLKSPVNNILALSTLLSRMVPEDQGKEGQFVTRIKGAAESLLDKIKDILELARAERALEIEPEWCSLHKMTSEIIDSLSESVKRKSATFDIDFGPAPEVFYPVKNLESILQNLIGNALKYAKPDVDAHIQMSSSPAEEGGVHFTIADNGLGMDLEKMGDSLFQLFQRFHSHVEGTGVGLHLVKKLVEANGGRIEVESAPGKGTAFHLFLHHSPGFSTIGRVREQEKNAS